MRAELAAELRSRVVEAEDPCQQPLTNHQVGKAFGSNDIEWVDQIESLPCPPPFRAPVEFLN